MFKIDIIYIEIVYTTILYTLIRLLKLFINAYCYHYMSNIYIYVYNLQGYFVLTINNKKNHTIGRYHKKAMYISDF